MARIRTIKPEFWEDEVVGALSMGARLLFIASWNLADDEGLLRWTAEYLKASVFMYDDAVGVPQVEQYMAELEGPTLVFPYRGGKTQQRLGWIVRFHRHQKINRPQPGKLPPPSLQSGRVKEAYADRDRWTCHLCGGVIPEDRSKVDASEDWISVDHVIPKIKGGSDYPSNIKIAHLGCNKSKCGSMPDSVNGSVSDSRQEGKGKDQGKDQGAGTRASAEDLIAYVGETHRQSVQTVAAMPGVGAGWARGLLATWGPAGSMEGDRIPKELRAEVVGIALHRYATDRQNWYSPGFKAFVSRAHTDLLEYRAAQAKAEEAKASAAEREQFKARTEAEIERMNEEGRQRGYENGVDPSALIRSLSTKLGSSA